MYLFVFLCIVICRQLVSAQDSMAVTKNFFNNRSPSLLFHVSNLNLAQYEGGIGMAFYGSDDIQWRLSVGIGFSDSFSESNKESDFNTQRYRNERNEKNMKLNMSTAPLITFRRFDFGFLFWSPVLKINYLRESIDNNYWDSLGVHTGESNYKSSSWGVSVGGSLGGGITISERITLIGEYRFSIDYMNGKQEEFYPSYRINEGYFIVRGDSYRININSTALLTLFYKL